MEFKPSSKRMDFFSIDKYSKKVEENCKIVYTVYDTYFYNKFKRKKDTINGYDFIEVSWAKNCQKTNLIIFIIARVSSIKFFFYIFPVYFYILERSTVKTNIVHWSNQVYNTIEELITGKNIQTHSSTHFLQSFTNDAYASTHRSYIFRGHVIALQPYLLAGNKSDGTFSLQLQFHPWNKEAKRGVTLVALRSLRSLSGGRSTEFLFNIVKRNCNHISILMGGVEKGVTTRAFYRDAFIKERSLGRGEGGIEWYPLDD